MDHRIISPLLFSENIAIKFWEKDITVEFSHDVGQINKITPWMLKTFLINEVNIYQNLNFIRKVYVNVKV